MASRILALIIWAAVAASLAYWGLRWLARPTGVPANATPVSLDGGAQGDPHRLLSGPAKPASAAQELSAASALAARLKLLGVVAPRHEGETGGIALLSVDGKPPRAVRVGGVVDGDMVLKSLTQRGASIGTANGPAAVTLDLPLLPAATTGALPPISGITTTPDAYAQTGGAQPPGGGAPGAPGGMQTGSDTSGIRGAMGNPPGAPEGSLPPGGVAPGRGMQPGQPR